MSSEHKHEEWKDNFMLHVMTHLESSHAYYKKPRSRTKKSLSNSSVEFLPTKSPHADFGQNTVIFAPVVHLLCPDSRLWERLVFNFAKLEVCEANFIKSFCFMIFPEDVLKTKRPHFPTKRPTSNMTQKKGYTQKRVINIDVLIGECHTISANNPGHRRFAPLLIWPEIAIEIASQKSLVLVLLRMVEVKPKSKKV